jgi:hypothetical protein
MIEKLLVLSMCACGLYYILAYSRIFAWVRKYYPTILQELLSCSACSGFWLGAWGGLLFYPVVPDLGIIGGNYASLALTIWISGLWVAATNPIVFKVMLTSLDFLAKDLEQDQGESGTSDAKLCPEWGDWCKNPNCQGKEGCAWPLPENKRA